ncbi:MAG: hypothetical protein EOO75_02315 [Myxococcales bacterium]|nr:MAG: hypothetical protein EOO75_02315 [Myxococcales bacterium]
MSRALALVALLTLAGCAARSSDGYRRSLAAGDRAKSAGRYDEAAAAYAEAARAASKERDRDEGAFLEAATLAQGGRHQEAMAAYDRLIAASPRGERSERAVYERALLEIEHGDAAAGWAALERALLTLPGAGTGRRALHKLVEHAEAEAPGGGGHRWLDAHRATLAKTELDEDVRYLIAKALEAEGKAAEARAAYVACAEAHPYPFGSLTDDSWWNAAALADKQGDAAAAVTYLQRLLAPREVATMKQGSYERPRYAAAQYRLAELYRDRLADPLRARREFHVLYERHTTSPLRDDALWNEALLARQAGDRQATCDVARELVRALPESRYAGCASQLCPGQSDSPKAPACRDYLRAALSP